MTRSIQVIATMVFLVGSIANAGESMISPVSAEETLSYMECPAYDPGLKPEQNLYREAQLIYRDQSVTEVMGNSSSKNGLIVNLAVVPGTQKFIAEVKIIRAFRVGAYIGQSANYGTDPHSTIEGMIIRNDDGSVEFENLGMGKPSVYTSQYGDYPAFDITLTNSTLLSDKGGKAVSTATSSMWGSTYGSMYGVISDYKHPCDQR